MATLSWCLSYSFYVVGNCLFASLSDQLYGIPNRHDEIRATIIEHMRNYRPLYEDFVHANDIIQKRATRSTTEAVRKQMEEDVFEGYLTAMSRSGTYGGQPELLAFVRAYDQDVMVHLPPSMSRDRPTLDVKNEHREEGVVPKPALHICYGGDEEKHAHYDSSQKTETDDQDHALTSRPKPFARYNLHTIQQNGSLSPRAVRSMRADPTKDMMHELVTRGSKDLRGGLEMLNDQRARSPSIASSHYSTSSKRSFDDDGDQPRSSKRTDRKISSLRGHAAFKQYRASPHLMIPNLNSQPTSSGPPTPTSSQDTDSSSEHPDQARDEIGRSAINSPIEVISLIDDDDDEGDEDTQDRHNSVTAHLPEASSRRSQISAFDQRVPPAHAGMVTETNRPTLRT